MDLDARLRELADDIPRSRKHATDEAKTIDYWVQPFFYVLGYDPTEPEDAEREHNKSDAERDRTRADYMLKWAGKEIIVVEVKQVGTQLRNHRKQLAGYFENRHDVRFAVLTDGIKFELYSDLSNSNTMDPIPFLDIQLELLYDWQVTALRAFTKSEFDLKKTASVAIILNHIRAMAKPPSDSIVQVYFSEVRSGRLIPKSAAEFESFIMSDTVKSEEESTTELGQPGTFGSKAHYRITDPVLIRVFADYRGERIWAKFVLKRKYPRRGDRVIRLNVTWHDPLFESDSDVGYFSVSKSAKMVMRHIKKKQGGQTGGVRQSNRGWTNFWFFIDQKTKEQRSIDDFRNDPRLLNRYLRKHQL